MVITAMPALEAKCRNWLHGITKHDDVARSVENGRRLLALSRGSTAATMQCNYFNSIGTVVLLRQYLPYLARLTMVWWVGSTRRPSSCWATAGAKHFPFKKQPVSYWGNPSQNFFLPRQFSEDGPIYITDFPIRKCQQNVFII
jgi:hypothetical protein